MNIIKKEIRFSVKVFFFWFLGLAFLLVAGLTKFTGIEGGMDINKLLDQFPRIILAVMGMGGGVDFMTLPGYYSVMMYYVYVVTILYAVHLGSSAVNRELIDRTYEFIFTKPRTRAYILGMKLSAGMGFLVVFCLMNIPLSFAGLRILETKAEDVGFVYSYTGAVFLSAFLFFTVGVFFSALLKRPERGAMAANLCFLLGFVAGVVYDMYDKASALKVIAPLRFFEAKDLLDGKLDPVFAFFCLLVGGTLLFFAFRCFEKRDFTE